MKTLLEETYDLLDSTPIPIKTVARHAGVGQRWLYKLYRREIENPGVVGVQQLNTFLKSTTNKRQKL